MSQEGAFYAIGFLVYLALGCVAPLVPEFQRDLNASIAEVSVVIAAFGFARLCIDVPAAGLGTRLGYRVLLSAGTACLALAYGGSALASGIAGLIVGQAAAGLGSAFCHVTTLVVLGAGSRPDRSGRTMGRYFMATFAGLTVGGPLSGAIAGRAGWRAAFLVAAAASALALLLVNVAAPIRRPARRAVTPTEITGWRGVLHPRLWSVYLLHFTALFLWAGVRGTLWPILAAAEGRLSAEAIGAALGACSLLSLGALYVAGIAGDRYGKRPVIAIGLLAAGTGIGLLVGAADPRVIVAGLALQDLGQGFMAGNASALLADVLRGPGIGLATGVMRLTADVGGLAGPLLLGAMAGAFGYGAASVLAAAVPLANLVLLGGLASGRLLTRRRGPANATMRP